ncbi:MAG: DUF1844 domain-containing protein [Candidatus Goldbacteria bacterium]|nr:DUF1844 domain-containing protein [Candidatus Goldiibacteriota bacterium]
MENKKNQEENIDFINLILMLNQNALISLGEIPRFVGGKKNTNLPLARQTINMIKAIQEKTKNNLTPGESKLIFRILGDLQKKYVTLAGLDKPGPVKSQSVKNELEEALSKLSNEDLEKILYELKKHADEGNK